MTTDGQSQEDERPKLTGDAAYKAHLADVDRRNVAARKKAQDQRSRTESAAISKAQKLKGG